MTRIDHHVLAVRPSKDTASSPHTAVQANADDGTNNLPVAGHVGNADLPLLITDLQQNLNDINLFYCISASPRKRKVLRKFLGQTSQKLKAISFDTLKQSGKVDYLMLQSYIDRKLQELEFQEAKHKQMQMLLEGYFEQIDDFCMKRQAAEEQDWQWTAGQLDIAAHSIEKLMMDIDDGRLKWKESKSVADQATKIIIELRDRVAEAFAFYKGYDPIATWWLERPCQDLRLRLERFNELVRVRLIGIKENDQDAIIGDPIGEDGLEADLAAEFIAYTPQELISIGEQEYQWCEKEMIKASEDLGYKKDWRKALEHVKTLFVEPGKQVPLVQKLAKEAADYVKRNNMVTVPEICETTRRTFMMTPERQKVSPFFLGGTNIIVSYPTNEMDHSAKMMSMRGNSIPFSKATVFHELIPGHHLQYHYIKRHNTYRRNMFDTPFWMEGWALYWEFLLWERGDFFQTSEEKIGTLFWRMHRCARIIFSLKFHLGQMTPQQCVDYLVERVGHERATAEGEVRRSFNGDYRPLYQAGYMLGALQLRYLRHELVDSGKMQEKAFHDRILQENEMPIDMVRALLGETHLTRHHKPTWRFYNKRWHSWGSEDYEE